MWMRMGTDRSGDTLVAASMWLGLLLLFAVSSVSLAWQPVDPAVVAQQARAAMTAGRFAEAAGLYRTVVKQLPAVGGMRLNLGLALFQSGEHRAAAAEFQAALKLDPRLAPAAMMLGLCHAKLGEPLAAIPLLERALAREPANTVVLLELADAYYAAGRFAEAVEHFRRLTALQPANALAWRGLGLSLTELSQSLFAQLTPGSAEALTLLARARMAADEPKAAYSLLRQAIAKEPGFGPAYGYLAALYRKMGHADWAEAAMAKAGLAPARFAAVVAASDDALAALERLAALGPSAALHETEAEAARARGAYPEAIALFRKALALQAGAAPLERGLARALFASRAYEEALPLLRKHKLTFELGTALLETGKAAEAIPHLLGVRTAAGQAALGRAYLGADQPAKAVGPLRAGLASDTDGSVHFQLARALQRTGATAQAQEMDRVSQQMRQRKAEQQEAAGAVAVEPL